MSTPAPHPRPTAPAVSGPPADRQPPLRVTEFTDPACPWAWGAEPVFRLLRHTWDPYVRWRRVFGILFDEDDDPAPDADAEARWYEGFVRGVAEHTRAPYAPRLHWLTRTSWPASLAAKSARAQGGEVAERVLRRLRETTFVLGAPADTPDGVEDALRGIPGLDLPRLLTALGSAEAREAVGADWAETRAPLADVLDLEGPGPHPGRAKEVGDRYRYALPTVLFEGPGGRKCVPGWQPLEAYIEAAEAVAGGPLPRPGTLSPGAALARWHTLTGPELALLTGEFAPPSGAVRVETGNGPLWLHPEEARHHPATRA
ncbi:DsbA family protein [Streptomyces sp. NPDC091292]|uniref:DsbA family oxidoreductase n=1 Tax=Streptomyces sp. NPDC091292 TaxID=3365991 RepID=UPI00380B524A